jgi:hypothetical protein
MTISQSRYKDQPAITIETDTISAQFLPTIGAKLCSLVYKPQNFELMVQRPAPEYRLQPYDGVYEEGECSGFDDMFPTIDRGVYGQFPWQDVMIPDHGEVWSLPWDMRISDDRLAFTCHGVRFPYELGKQVYFADSSRLRIEYTLTNLSVFDMDFVWAAHIMLNLEDNVALVLPPSVKRIVTTFSRSGLMGNFGDAFDFPMAHLTNGETQDLRQLRPPSAQDAFKYYVDGKLSEGWCALNYRARGLLLALSFPTDTVPYLGILPNEGGWQDIYNIFLEPATAAFDSLKNARQRDTLSTIPAKSEYKWHLNVTLMPGASVSGVSADGNIWF